MGIIIKHIMHIDNRSCDHTYIIQIRERILPPPLHDNQQYQNYPLNK